MAPDPAPATVPATDYDTKNCTGGNCDRRAAYLKTATELLASRSRMDDRAVGPEGRGPRHRAGDPEAGLKSVFVGLGSLSYGELAGERMKLGPPHP